MGNLRFILGRAGSGKTTLIVEEITRLLAADPLGKHSLPGGDPILLLVPDQATLLYERQIACGGLRSEVGGLKSGVGSRESKVEHRICGYLRLRVITFTQMIERLLCEGGGSAIPEITPLGRRILIGRLLRRMQPELTFYKSTARQPGLAGKLDEAFAEIERSGRNLDDLLFIAGDVEAQNPRSSLPAKLRDLHLLIKEYERVLGGERLDQHRRFALAIKAAETSPSLARTRVYVDDFYDFTSTERTLIVQVARHALATSVCLSVDPKAVPALLGDAPIDEGMLLRSSSLALRRLHRTAMDSRLATEQVLMKGSPRFEAPELIHIDRQFEADRPGKIEPAGNLAFVEAPSRRDEVDAAARQIQAWAREGLRLRDILVLARDINQYEREVEASFREHGIACFIDRQRPASHHPLIRTVRALLQLPLTDFRQDVVTDLVKAGLCGVSADASDDLENYLLAHRIRGSAVWAERWVYQSRRRGEDDDAGAALREQIESINATRARIYAGVSHLLSDQAPGVDESAEPLVRTAKPASEWCVRLCRAMDALEVNKKLAERIQQKQVQGKMEAGAADAAVWTEFSELLDQLCSVLGDEQLTLREYAEVMDVALERFTLAITPPTIDQVLVGSVDRTRSANIKACIVLGLSEGVFPQRVEDVTALSDEDRDILDQRQFELRGTTRCTLMDEQTLAYLALTRPSQKLMVTRFASNDDGQAVGPSLFWTHLQRLFKGLEVQKAAPGLEGIATSAQLAEAIVDWAQAAIPDIDAAPLTRWFDTSTDEPVRLARLALSSALHYDNKAALRSDVARELFTDPLTLSATRLETFAACPFKHFAQYTLGLRPREEADLTRLDLGTVYHQVMENLIGEAIREKMNFAEPLPGLKDKIRHFSAAAAADLRSELMLTPGRNQYLLEGVERTMDHVAETTRRAIAAGAFRPKRTEFSFGFNNKHPPLVIVTPRGHTLQLRGRIDRIDAWQMDQGLAASVIDYKLGAHEAHFARVRHGLSLQLLTYLLVLDALGEQLMGSPVQPAAAFYVRLLRSIDSISHPSEAPPPDEMSAYMKKYRPRGVVDERFVDSIDPIESFPLKPRSDQKKLSQGDVLSPEAFTRLVDWTRAKIAQLADEMIAGNINVTPYRMGKESPCPHCNFRAVCRLDYAFNDPLKVVGNSTEALEAIVKGTSNAKGSS